jgi:hypothetical protein
VTKSQLLKILDRAEDSAEVFVHGYDAYSSLEHQEIVSVVIVSSDITDENGVIEVGKGDIVIQADL